MPDSSFPVCVLTGAGSGIGRAAAQLLAAAGFGVALVGRNLDSLEQTRRLCLPQAMQPDALMPMVADISDPQQVSELVLKVRHRFGRIDVLINNAAVVQVQLLAQTDAQTLRTIFAINAMGPMLLVAACWPVFQRQTSSRVVNVSSMSTIDPFPGLGAYAASKAALESVTRSIMNEGRDLSIVAFNVILGAVETKMLRSVASTEALPPSRVLDPMRAAEVIVACAAGHRDAEAGRSIIVPSP